MITVKFLSAMILVLMTSLASAAIIEGEFHARVYSDESDEGIWSRELTGSEVIGEFWYDTELAPTPNLDFFPLADYQGYANSWLNITYFIDGKIVNISELTGDYTDVQASESVIIDPERDFFRIDDGVIEGNILEDYVYRGGYLWIEEPIDIIHHTNLEQKFDWVSDGSLDDNAGLYLSGRSNGQEYTSDLKMYLTEFSIATRETPVPAPWSLPLLLISLLTLAFRRTVHFQLKVATNQCQSKEA